MGQYAFHINADKCITCKVCALACKEKKNLKPGFKFRRVYTVTGGRWDSNAYVYSVSVGCNHCEKPACQSACPAAAITKRASDGIVYIDKDICIGCGSCAAACPYSASSFDRNTLKADKCDFCRELVDMGQIPYCVGACSMNVIDCGELDVLKTKYPDAVQQVYPLASPEQTNPSLLITRHRKSTGGESDSSARIVNMPEELQAAEL